MKRIRLPLYVTMCFVFIAAIPLTANADHAWGNYHWERSSNPVGLEVGDNVEGDWDGHLTFAVADWSESSVLDLIIASGQSKGNCKPTDGRIEVCNKGYGYNGWLGLAQIWVSGDHITQGVAKMNDTYFSAAPYNTSEWRQLVMCQEIAHDFGLGHQDENFDNGNLGSCMDYTSDPLANQQPNQHDYEMLESIYNDHLDGGGGDGGGNGGNCDKPGNRPNCPNGNNGVAARELHSQAEWGQLVRTQGRTATYERDFGSGNRVVTFVIWAD